MTGRRGRKVHVVEVDGVAHNAYSTSITFSLTLDDLTHAIAIAATSDGPTGRRFGGVLSHNPVARESYWSERDMAEARVVAASLGPGHISSTARSELRTHGESWRTVRWGDIFPPGVARDRAEELFPMLADEGNPFAPPLDVDDS